MGFLTSLFKKQPPQMSSVETVDLSQHIDRFLDRIEKLECKIEKLQKQNSDYKNQIDELNIQNNELKSKLSNYEKNHSYESSYLIYPGYDEINNIYFFDEEQENRSIIKDNNNDLENNNEIDGIVLDKNNQSFINALDLIENSNKNLFLTGKAGTGKTTFLKYLTSKLKKKYIVLAPTGVAAVNAGGMTLHSFFQLSFSPYLPDDARLDKKELKFNKDKLDIIKNIETIIIDEISMVRCDIIDAISRILKMLRNNNKPFGGVQMIFIGDLFQLPPIADSRFWEFLGEFYENEFFFDSFAFKESEFKYIELTKVYRQNDIKFIDLLNRVRENKTTNADLLLLNSYYQNSVNHSLEGYITLSTHRKNVDSLNATKLSKLDTEYFKFEAVITGLFDERDSPADTILSLKIGAQVMLLKNNAPDYYNGSMGIIERIEEEVISLPQNEESKEEIIDDVIYIKLFSNNKTIKVTRSIWENIRYTYNKEKKLIESEIIGKFIQFPVKLAWAITIHKSQGLTFDKAIIDAGNAFAHGQTYVALSRCRSLEGILLKTKIDKNSIIVDQQVSEFMREITHSSLHFNKKMKFL